MKILIIDDEEMIRTLNEKILLKAGHEPLLSESGESGVAIFRNESDSIEVVIIDMTMDGMNGTETFKHIRDIKNEIPVIISTGDDVDKSDFPEELQQRLYILQKPFRAKELTSLIEEIQDEVSN